MAGIDKKLNVVVGVDMADGSDGFVHAMPLSREVFETHFLVISKMVAAIFGEGLTIIAGPRVASLMLKKVATDLGVWDTPGGVKDGLMLEIRRLSNLAVSTPGGWSSIPLQEAIDKRLIDDESLSELENALVFFTAVSAIMRPA